VQRLPEKYRAPFVLCCLEGLSKAEAAGELGWKEGTVSGRVAQARQLLQRRLARRGVTLSAVLTAVALTQNSAAAAAPPVLVEAAAHAGLAPAAGTAPAGGLSPGARTLADAVLRGRGWMATLAGLAALLGLVLLLGGAALVAFRRGADSPRGIADPPGGNADSAKGIKVDAAKVPLAPRQGPGRAGPARPGPARDEQVAALAFSPDGRRLVTAGARAGRPGYLRIWDIAAARELAAQEGIPGTSAVAFSPDGRTLASGEVGGDVKLRDPATGQERAALHGNGLGVTGLAFSPDGAVLASAGLDQTVKLWDLQAQQERQALLGHTDRVLAVAFFRHGRALVSGSADQTARIWDVPSGKERLTLRGHQGAVGAVAVSPDDNLVATAGQDGMIRLWDAATGQEAALLQGNDAAVVAVAFSPDGRFLAGAAGNRIRLWDVHTHRLIGSLEKQAAAISSLALSPDGNYLANGGLLGLTLLALHFDGAGEPAFGMGSGQEYFQSFQGGTDCPPGWELVGDDAEQMVHFEPGGLRISLPADYPEPRPATGVGTTWAVRGDFEITVSFEILREPEPADAGEQTRLSLTVVLDRPDPWRNMATVTRKVEAKGTTFGAWRNLVEEADGQPKSRYHGIPTMARTGRLQMKRTGSILSYSVAEGAEGEFTLLRQFPFGKEDLRTVRLVGVTGGPKASLDVRFKDLRIRAGSLPDPPPPTQPDPLAEAEAGSREKGWLAAVGLLVLITTILLGVGYCLHRLRAGWDTPDPAPGVKQTGPEAVAVSFTCPHCGKGLKARAGLAGKKVRCPQCAKTVSVPESPPAEDHPSP
jgi:hypothetical protein